MYQGLLMILLVVYAVEAGLVGERCIQGTRRNPMPQNPRQYTFCNNGVVNIKECKGDEVFDSELSDCVRFSANSDNFVPWNLAALTESDLTRTTESEFECPNKDDKDYPNPDDCLKYYHCVSGTYTTESCPKYFLFDVKTLSCRFFMFAICYDSSTSTTTTPTTTTQMTTTVSCPHDKEEDIPYPYSCKYYYHCDYGVETLKKCGWLQSFDVDKRTCRFSKWAKCP